MNIRHEQVAPYSYGYEVTFRSAGQGVSYRWECYCPLPEVAEQITHKIENAAPQVDISALLEGIALSERDKITSFVLESDSGLQRRGRYTGHVASAQDVHRGIALDGIILGHFQGDYSSMTTAKQNEAVRQEGLHSYSFDGRIVGEYSVDQKYFHDLNKPQKDIEHALKEHPQVEKIYLLTSVRMKPCEGKAMTSLCGKMRKAHSVEIYWYDAEEIAKYILKKLLPQTIVVCQHITPLMKQPPGGLRR